MATSIYDDKLIVPTDKMLKYDLGETKIYLDKISTFIAAEYGDLNHDWKFYNKKTGWILKLFSKKRNIIFIVPCQGYFMAAFTLGDKAVALVDESDISDDIKEQFKNAKKYMEGRTINFDIKNEGDLDNALKLVQVKMTKIIYR